MSYTFEGNSARMTDVFHGIAKRTMDEVREEITKAHRTWSPARIGEAVVNDPRVTNVLRAEQVMKRPRPLPNPDLIAEVYKRYGDGKAYGHHASTTNESIRRRSYVGRRAPANEAMGQYMSPAVSRPVNESSGQTLSPKPQWVGEDEDALPPNVSDSYKQLTRVAAEHKRAFPHLTPEKAMDEVIRTREGRELYQQDRATRLSAGGFGY